MTLDKKLTAFKQVLSVWETELTKYTLEELLKKPNDNAWSMGQVYNHLIGATLNFHLKQVEACLSTTQNQNKKKNFKGFLAFNIINGFPPIKITVPASETYTPKQPISIDELAKGLQQVKFSMEQILPLIKTANTNSKTAHPGFSFLNANDWYTMVDMHFRHHLRQRKIIDTSLLNK
jgi:DinB superfamily